MHIYNSDSAKEHGSNWTLDGLSFNVRENYYSSWTSARDYGVTVTKAATATTPAEGYANQRFGGKFINDLELSYTFAERFTLAVGAQNFTDEKPYRLKATSTIQLYPLTGGTSDG